MSRKRKRLVAIGASALVVAVAVLIAGRMLARRFEPYIREQAVAYLRQRFDSQVEMAALRVRLPNVSPLWTLVTRGRGAIARVEGANLSLRHKNRQDLPPLLSIQKFVFDVELGSLFEIPKKVRSVTLDGVEINIPPKGGLPRLSAPDEASSTQEAASAEARVFIGRALIRNARLAIIPKDAGKVPLRFDIHSLRLTSTKGAAMQYDATLTNPSPPGAIHSTGSFGPWVANEPGDTPLSGEYTFENADLGVFRAISGTLNSRGTFEGTLDSLQARGEATVPNFRLKRSGNPIRLATRFAVLVDGTNGNSILQPVHVTLGNTAFTTSGSIIKHEGDRRRAIGLDVSMPRGDLRDILGLAIKGPTFMQGRLALDTKIEIPPLSGKVREKLRLDGRFEVTDGRFLRSTIQDQIDQLSRRGQGQPNNAEIDEVISGMRGSFRLDDEILEFRSLTFGVPGALVTLKGTYNLGADVLDFYGSLKLQAKVSQTMTGWKRWALKPVDPFFAKNGAGTFLRIQVVGSAAQPKFGLDRSKKRPKAEPSARESASR
jgi:hypothetical protein